MKPSRSPLAITASILSLAHASFTGCSVDRAPRPTVAPVGSERPARPGASIPSGGEASPATLSASERAVAPRAQAQRPTAVVPAVPPSAPDPFADEAVAPDAPWPATPALPTPDPAIARRVAALVPIAERAAGCWTGWGERIDHTTSPRCNRWFATLANGGAPAAHAIGRRLIEDRQPPRVTLERLLEVLARADSTIGAQYVVHALGRSLASEPRAADAADPTPDETQDNRDDETHRRAVWISSFERLTGLPVMTGPPWMGSSLTRRRAVIDAAVRALRAWEVAGADPSRLSALADERVRRWVQADDVRALRAAEVLVDRRENRPLAIATLRRIERGGGSSEAIRYAGFLLGRIDRVPPWERPRSLD